ncbi:MAG TPA: hypothetical protein VFR19_15145 [Hyphomicrobiaceae bacterium]|nr:hypothetical protein [Hyphomicrobiaceae bacterium]
MTVLDLIDGRIAELDRLTAAASPDGGEAGSDGRELTLLLGALRALRQHKVAGAAPGRGNDLRRRGAHRLARPARGCTR